MLRTVVVLLSGLASEGRQVAVVARENRLRRRNSTHEVSAERSAGRADTVKAENTRTGAGDCVGTKDGLLVIHYEAGLRASQVIKKLHCRTAQTGHCLLLKGMERTG